MCAHPWHWAHRRSACRHRPARGAVGTSSRLQFSSAVRTKLACGCVLGAAGRATRLGLSRGNLAPDQGVEIGRGFKVLDFLKHLGRFGVHFSADFLIVLFRELAALVFELEVLNIPENDFFLSLEEIPLSFLND